MSGGSLLRPVTAEPRVRITVGGRGFSIARARLGGYLRLQLASHRVLEAGASQDTGSLADALFAFLEGTIELSREAFEQAPWLDLILAFKAVIEANALPNAQELAILQFKTEGTTVAWDYPQRPLIIWLHLFASAYGWTKEEVMDLWPEEAMALLQEIQADELADKEFQHMHSTLAYDQPQEGRAVYKPLSKPNWMVMSRKPLKMKIERSLLPIGTVFYPKDGQNGYGLEGDDGRG